MASSLRLRLLHLGLLVLVGACEPAGGDGSERAPATAPGTIEPGSAPATDLTCSDPVQPSDTAASLLERYRGQVRAETLHGPEGSELPGLVLWPDDPTRRIEVVFAEEGRRTVSLVRLSRASTWRVAGLAIGDPLARANAANGKPFKLWGFGWDYGGNVSNLEGGRLAALPGGCRVVMAVGPQEDAELPDGLVGDLELSSDDPRLEAAGVMIWELSLGFPAPDEDK